MRTIQPLSVADHTELACWLFQAHHALQETWVTLARLRGFGKTGRHRSLSGRTTRQIARARSQLEEAYFREHRAVATVRTYYPGASLPLRCAKSPCPQRLGGGYLLDADDLTVRWLAETLFQVHDLCRAAWARARVAYAASSPACRALEVVACGTGALAQLRLYCADRFRDSHKTPYAWWLSAAAFTPWRNAPMPQRREDVA